LTGFGALLTGKRLSEVRLHLADGFIDKLPPCLQPQTLRTTLKSDDTMKKTLTMILFLVNKSEEYRYE
jgi:hypothetical protein